MADLTTLVTFLGLASGCLPEFCSCCIRVLDGIAGDFGVVVVTFDMSNLVGEVPSLGGLRATIGDRGLIALADLVILDISNLTGNVLDLDCWRTIGCNITLRDGCDNGDCGDMDRGSDNDLSISRISCSMAMVITSCCRMSFTSASMVVIAKAISATSDSTFDFGELTCDISILGESLFV